MPGYCSAPIEIFTGGLSHTVETLSIFDTSVSFFLFCFIFCSLQQNVNNLLNCNNLEYQRH